MLVVLHVGMHKTGTSSFQYWLRNNQDALWEHGIGVFPLETRILANVPVCFEPDSLRHTIAELEQSGIHTILFSHETLSECFSSDLMKISEVLFPHSIRYVITFRHWSGFLLSRWQQNCSRRDTQSLHSYLEVLNYEQNDRIEAHYSLPVSRALEAGITDIRVVSYDMETLTSSLMQSLAANCALPIDVMTHPKLQQRYNVSNAPGLSDRVRVFNGIVSAARSRDMNPMASRSRTGQAPDVFFDLHGDTCRILARNTQLNQWLSQELDRHRSVINLGSKRFADWQERSTRFLAPFMEEKYQGNLFPYIGEMEIDTSRVEYCDLPTKLQQQVKIEVEAIRPELFQ